MGVKVCHGKDTGHFENKILRFIFGLEMEEVTWGWGQPRSDKLYSSYHLSLSFFFLLSALYGPVWPKPFHFVGSRICLYT